MELESGTSRSASSPTSGNGEGGGGSCFSLGCAPCSRGGEDTPRGQQAEAKDEDVEGIKGTRWATALMILVWIAAIVFSTIDMGWTTVECEDTYDDDKLDSDCVRYSSVFRVCAVAILVVVIQALFSICSINAYDSYWIVKLLVIIGASAAMLLTDATFFDDKGYIWVARIAAFIFIIFQQSILLDFAYTWNKSWVDKEGTCGCLKSFLIKSTDCYACFNEIWKLLLLVVSVVYIVAFAATMGVLYHYYGGHGCGDNVTIITVSLVLTLVALGIQLSGQHGSIIASGIVALYVAYLTYVAVSLNPDDACNPTVGNQTIYGVGQFVIGIVVCFLSILWISVITTRTLANLLGSATGVLNVVVGNHSGTTTSGAVEELEQHRHIAVLNLNFIFVLILFYISMIMTDWGTITTSSMTDSPGPTAGTTSMWMQATGAWVAVGLYIIGLIKPAFKLLPESIWDLKFETS